MEQFGKSVCTQQPTTAEGTKTEQKYIIGGATYLVCSHYKDSGAITALDKIARLIDKDT